MEQFTVTKSDGSTIKLISTLPFRAVTSAALNTTLMGEDVVQMTVLSDDVINLALGDRLRVYGRNYTIRTKPTLTVVSDNKYSYDITFYGIMYDLIKTIYRDTDISGKSSRSTFDLTYSLADMVKVVVYNMSRGGNTTWRFDSTNCPVVDPKTINFSKNNCLQALQTICETFGYEFVIDQRIDFIPRTLGMHTEIVEVVTNTIRVGKFGSILTPPSGSTHFEVGKGRGLYDLKEQKVDDRSVITRLWVEGGTNNIKSGYRDYSDRLQLPLRRMNLYAHVLSDGTSIAPNSELIGIDSETKRYIEDVVLTGRIGCIEDVEQYDDLYPTRTGIVSAIGSDMYSFADNSMDFDLNEKDSNGTRWMVDGTRPKIAFISGKLAGMQFELSGYVHSSKTFTLIKFTDERNTSFPSNAFSISVGDKYKIVDINLPDSYVNKAEEDLWYAGMNDFNQRKVVRVQYELNLDRSYFQQNFQAETMYFKVGDYVPVRNTKLGLESNIRIQKVTMNLLAEHDYKITVSDITASSLQLQIVQSVANHEVIIKANKLNDLSKARRGWRTTEDLRNMVFDTDGYFDTENIKPNSIDTNMLSVGSKSQQFVLADVVFEPNLNGDPTMFRIRGGILQHVAIEKNWDLNDIELSLSQEGGYYLVAKCSKSSTHGVFIAVQERVIAEPADDPNNYYFQIGIIGPIDNVNQFRDFTTTYGFSRINGNTITTGKIKNSDSSVVVDLDAGEIRGNLKYKSGEEYKSLSDTMPGVDVIKEALGNPTQIDGGLILTSIIKLLAGNESDTETAGVSGNSNVAFWAGGTLDEALANTAKTILRGDGSGQLASGAISWNTDGKLLLKGEFESEDMQSSIQHYACKFKTDIEGGKICLLAVANFNGVHYEYPIIEFKMDVYEDENGIAYVSPVISLYYVRTFQGRPLCLEDKVDISTGGIFKFQNVNTEAGYGHETWVSRL